MAVLLKSPDKNRRNSRSFRGISLLPVLAKVLEKILVSTLMEIYGERSSIHQSVSRRVVVLRKPGCMLVPMSVTFRLIWSSGDLKMLVAESSAYGEVIFLTVVHVWWVLLAMFRGGRRGVVHRIPSVVHLFGIL